MNLCQSCYDELVREGREPEVHSMRPLMIRPCIKCNAPTDAHLIPLHVARVIIEASRPPCLACSHCGIEPGDMDPTCHHEKAGPFGKHVMRGRIPECGAEALLFVQHPMRNVDGSLKS